MASLSEQQARVCLTAAGCLIHQNKVLLVKHKKLGFWLNPGGHIELNELPHQTAEREFWEETGVRVTAYDPQLPQVHDGSEYMPNPFLTNLHWISQENYHYRLNGTQRSSQTERDWQRGCEQHLNFIYLVKPVDRTVKFAKNVEETDGIAWFSLEELAELETKDSIRVEVQQAFDLIAQYQ